MGLNKNIKVVIFDFDGTIFNLDVDWAELKNSLGLDQNDLALGEAIEQYHQEKSDKINVITDRELEAVGIQGLSEAVGNTFKSLLSKNYKLAIFSRNSSKTIKKVLKNSRLDDNIYIVGREEVNRLKPDKEGLEFILKHYYVEPQEAVLVGDTYHDIVAGHAAGTKVVIVDNPKNQYIPEGADKYISDIADIISELKAEAE